MKVYKQNHINLLLFLKEISYTIVGVLQDSRIYNE